MDRADKPRYRLCRLRDCMDGTRFYFEKIARSNGVPVPYTLITTSYSEAIIHRGHAYNRTAKRLRVPLWSTVWRKIS